MDYRTLLRGRLDNQLWRLSHLYWIENKAGQMQRFSMNRAQRRVYDGMHERNAILKARQLGISTFVSLLMLDRCLFQPNYHAGIIDKALPDAEQKLGKIRFAWENLDHLPPHASLEEQALAELGRLIKENTGQLRSGKQSPITDTRSRIGFSNGSDIRIGTTLRGGTMQMLHISELAHTSVHSPWRAREIRTGGINTVPQTGSIFLESTHEGGRFGVNYEFMEQAMENRAKEELSPLEFAFFFLSWFDHDEYQLKGRNTWSDRLSLYFHKLENESGIQLSNRQKCWYARMEHTMGSSMQQEYPSTPDEAFATGNEGSIYGRQIANLREQGRIGTEFVMNPDAPLYCSWDLGLSDHTAIWLIQIVGGEIYWLDHYSANQQGIDHFVHHIKKWEEMYGSIEEHFLPHDAAHRDPHGHSYVESLARRGISSVRVVPRTPDVWRGINQLRSLLMRSWFHPNTLKNKLNHRGLEEPSGLRCLEMYRTTPPSEGGALRDTPLHDQHSHSSDAARSFAEAYAHHMVGSTHCRNKKKTARMS